MQEYVVLKVKKQNKTKKNMKKENREDFSKSFRPSNTHHLLLLEGLNTEGPVRVLE